MLDHEQPPRLYDQPWPPFAKDPFQGPAQPVTPESPAWDGPRHSQTRPAWRRLLPWLLPVTLAAAIAGVVLAVTQGGNAAAPGATAANVRVCQDLRTQTAAIKKMGKSPSLLDGLKIMKWMAQDAGAATPGTQLKSDLEAIVNNGKAAHTAAQDCAAAGVDMG